MKNFKILAVPCFLTLGVIALAGCPSNGNSPSAPVTVIVVETPTYPPCVSGGFTCTPSPTPTITSTPTPTPADWVITGPVTLTSGQYSYHSIHIEAGGSLNVQGAVTLGVSGFFAQDTGTTITGDGTGYPMGQGPTTVATNSAGGGGHGGPGGADGLGLAGAAAYDSSTAPASMGDGGGAGEGTNACNASEGGGFFAILASGASVTLNGLISEQGHSACPTARSYGSGGGAGGTIYVQAVSLTGSGTLQVNGGNGDTFTGYQDGGGGGGGIIVFSTHSSNSFSGSLTADGGHGGVGSTISGGAGSNGDVGIINTTTY